MSEPFIGEIKMFGGNFAPRNWAFCDGQLLPISQNQALFSILGTTYGGDGRTTFALPDLRSRVAVHAGQGAGLSDYRLGQKGGNEQTFLSAANMPNHNHSPTAVLNVSEDDADSVEPSGRVLGTGLQAWTSSDAEEAAGATAITTTSQNVGSNIGFSNIPPYQAVNYIIALFGLFPSRS